MEPKCPRLWAEWLGNSGPIYCTGTDCWWRRLGTFTLVHGLASVGQVRNLFHWQVTPPVGTGCVTSLSSHILLTGLSLMPSWTPSQRAQDPQGSRRAEFGNAWLSWLATKQCGTVARGWDQASERPGCKSCFLGCVSLRMSFSLSETLPSPVRWKLLRG